MAAMQKPSKKRIYSRKFYIAKASVLAIFPLVLLVLPAHFFDHGTDICLFTLLSGYSCWGCGITRACMHLIHLDFAAASNYNKLSFVVLPILCGLLVDDFRKTMKHVLPKKETGSERETATTES
jgi:hypothetical protein